MQQIPSGSLCGGDSNPQSGTPEVNPLDSLVHSGKTPDGNVCQRGVKLKGEGHR